MSQSQPIPCVTTFVTTLDGYPLTSRWTYPAQSRNPSAVALLLPGSVNVGLDGYVSAPGLGKGYQGQPARLHDQLANRLAEVGVASFRYAKRGVEHPELIPNRSFQNLLQDALSAWKKMEQEHPSAKKFIIGLSEGAIVALLLAETVRADALFLLGLPTRSIDEIVEYQSIEWPVRILSKIRDEQDTDLLRADALKVLGENQLLPVLEISWPSIAQDASKGLSISEDLLPRCKAHQAAIQQALNDESLVQWYSSLKALRAIPKIANQINSPKYVYQGLDDAQINSDWLMSDLKTVPNVRLRTYAGVGHCFSPMEGELGQIKTSGPLCQSLLDDLAQDIAAELSSSQGLLRAHASQPRPELNELA